MRRAHWIAAVVVAACPAWSSDAIRLPDPKEGQINGVVAVMFWPAKNTGGGKVDTLLPTDDCQVILAPWTDFSAERRYRCGIWFQPPEGRYQVWIEKGTDQITPTSGTFHYAPEPFQDRGHGVVMPVHSAGRVALAPDIALPANAELSLINFDSCCTASKLGNPFARRAIASAPSLRSGLLVPVGRVFAGIFDRATRDAIAIAQPVRVDEGKVSTVAPRPPADGTSDVFVSLGRPNVRTTRDVDAIELTLAGRRPQALFDGSDRIYAAWYGVKGTSAELAASSKTLRLPTRVLKLTPGRVVTVREELQMLPSVAVSLLSPAGALDGETVHVEARQPAHAGPLRSTEIHAGEELRLEALPAEPLDVVLSVGPWRFREHVDLTSGIDGRVVFDLHPIVVSGEVFYGNERSANAEVAFEADDGFVRKRSDDAGRYELTLWHGSDAWSAEVTVPGRAGPPFIEGFLQINGSQTLDFHVPRTLSTVRVLDAGSGRAIAGASVSAANIFTHRSGEEMTLIQHATTDTDGIASLAPLRRGKLEIRAYAGGYRDSEKIDAGRIEAGENDRDFEVRLRPIGAIVRIRLRTDDGRPAAGADLWAVAATHGVQRPLWRGQSDADGVAEVPRDLDGATLLIRSPFTASAVRPFHAGSSEREIVLQPAAPPIHVDAAPRTRIALWIDGVRVTGPAVTFLAWSSEASDAEGNWSAKNLPRQPLRILAWRRVPEPEIAAGLRDVSSTTIPYPWPSMVRLQPFE